MDLTRLRQRRRGRLHSGIILLLLVALAPAQTNSIFDYIRHTWVTLTRRNSAVDPKIAGPGRPLVYVAADDDANRVRRELGPGVEVRSLPADQPGLLYLPEPYVVPGGRFNEMYGWDSFFIQMGLLRDGETALARDMADNFLYEVRHYGKILNANRTYYLTRSQPPFLTEMLLAVDRRSPDREWLAGAVPAIEQYYRYWTQAPHLTPQTGLSRYFDSGEGPAPEVVASERDAQGRTHYDLAKLYFRAHPAPRFYDPQTDRLTAAFYKGDRSMRESGFDPSGRFGPFSADIVNYNPVCLNSLLYRMEIETAEILDRIGRRPDAALWRDRARDRAERVNRLMWDDRAGLYFDYNFESGRRRPYPFLTTFYPLWAGIASPEQARRVAANLPRFERAGGLQTSTRVTGDQWDAPFGWAPLQYIAVEGLRRYGFHTQADRISRKFLSLVFREYRRTGTLVEKYDVARNAADIRGQLKFGYRSNEAGFGWTNAVFTALFDSLGPEERRSLLKAWGLADLQKAAGFVSSGPPDPARAPAPGWP